MPYANADKQRTAKRESARRRRAETSGTGVEPTVSPDAAPVIRPDVTIQEIYQAGRLLGRVKERGESNEAYHEELRHLWRQFLRVVEGDG